MQHPGRGGVICNSAGLSEQASGFEDLRGYNVNEAANWPGVRTEGQRTDRRLPARLWAVGVAIAALGFAWLAYSYRVRIVKAMLPAPPARLHFRTWW